MTLFHLDRAEKSTYTDLITTKRPPYGSVRTGIFFYEENCKPRVILRRFCRNKIVSKDDTRFHNQLLVLSYGSRRLPLWLQAPHHDTCESQLNTKKTPVSEGLFF